MIRVYKLLIFHHDLVKSFKKIDKDKFDNDVDGIDNIIKLSIADICICVHLKFQLDDELLLLIKKELLKHWESEKQCYSLTDNIEYLSMFWNIINKIIKELLYGEWEASSLVVNDGSNCFDNDNAPEDDVDSCICFSAMIVNWIKWFLYSLFFHSLLNDFCLTFYPSWGKNSNEKSLTLLVR